MTQQWAVLGALSRDKAQGGVSMGDLARYLMATCQDLSGAVSRNFCYRDKSHLSR